MRASRGMGCIRPELTKPKGFAKGGETKSKRAGKAQGKQFVAQPKGIAKKTAGYR